MKPPKMSTAKAVYDKVDGPIYFVRGGKVYRKGYADGGDIVSADADVNNLTPDQRTKYNLLTNPQDRAAFLDNVNGIIKTGGSGSAIAKAAPAIASAAGSLIDASRGNSNANTTLNDTVQGALGTAGQGASVGSLFGPEGTAIGAGIGALVGGTEGFFKGRKDQKNMDATALANKNAAVLSEKQRRDAAARANMNPWDVGYADGGDVIGGEDVASTTPVNRKINAAQAIAQKGNYLNAARGVLDDYSRKQLGLPKDAPIPDNHELPYQKVNELIGDKYPKFYDYAKDIANDKSYQNINTPIAKGVKDLKGTDEFGKGQDVPFNQISYGPKMRSAKYPFIKDYNELPTANAPAIPTLKNGGPTPAKAAEILHDGTIRGKAITDKQRKYFGWLSNKMAKGGTVNFANEEKYHAWLAYGHMHHEFSGKEKISIAGKEHKVDHKAEGGKIVGAGTGKSDSIKAEIKANSFVVPAVNANVAQQWREQYLSNGGKANIKQKGGEDVRLSNGEHLFTPEEVEILKANGKYVNELAPNQEHGNHKAEGGGIEEEINKLLAEENTKAQSAKASQEKQKAYNNSVDSIVNKNAHEQALENSKNQNIDNVTRDLKTKLHAYKNAYSDEEKAYKLRALQNSFADYKQMKSNYDGTAQKTVPNSTNPNGTLAGGPMSQIINNAVTSAAGKAKSNQTNNTQDEVNPTVTNTNTSSNVNRGGIAGVGKKGYEFNAPTNPPLGQDIASAEQSNPDVINPAQSDITPHTAEGIKAAQDKLATTTPADKSPSFADKAGNFLKDNAGIGAGIAGLGLSAWQAKTGYDQLNKLGARPVDKIDADFAASVEQAKSDAKYGISPEERAIADKQIQANREADVANIVNQAGGSGGTALANIRGASANANDASNRLSAESERLRLEKQRYANNLVGQKAAMNRNLFEDKMNAFNTNQQAGSNLLGAGLQNAFGALRYTGEAANQRANAKTAQGGGGYPGNTTFTKKDYLSAYGGDEKRARDQAAKDGQNFDSLPF